MTEPVLVNSREVAALFGCSIRLVEQLAAEGVIAKVKPGRFDRDSATRSYIGHLRTIAAGRAPMPIKEQAQLELVLLRRAQRERIEDQRRREEVAIISREEHHRALALTAFSFRAAFQDVSDKIGRRLQLTKADWSFVEGLIDATLVHHVGLVASRAGLPEQELALILGQIRENYIEPPGGWLNPDQYPDPLPDPDGDGPLCPRPDAVPMAERRALHFCRKHLR